MRARAPDYVVARCRSQRRWIDRWTATGAAAGRAAVTRSTARLRDEVKGRRREREKKFVALGQGLVCGSSGGVEGRGSWRSRSGRAPTGAMTSRSSRASPASTSTCTLPGCASTGTASVSVMELRCLGVCELALDSICLCTFLYFFFFFFVNFFGLT